MGTNIVHILYDVAASDTPTVAVSLFIRDRLAIWEEEIRTSSATGHIGEGVPVGLNRYIVWDASEDWGLWRASYDIEVMVTAEKPSFLMNVFGNLNFGDVAVSQEAKINLEISNDGNTTILVEIDDIPEDFFPEWTTASLPPGKIRAMEVTFVPKDYKEYSGFIRFSIREGELDFELPVSGRGIVLPTRILTISGDINFGSVGIGQSATRNIIFQNTGNSPLTINSITFSSGIISSYWSGFRSSWPGGTIQPNSSQQVTVFFEPTMVKNYGYNSRMRISSNQTSGTSIPTPQGEGVFIWSQNRPLGGDRSAVLWIKINQRWIANKYTNGDITYSDLQTGMMWIYNPLQFGQGPWASTNQITHNLNYGGHTDWVFPDRDQLSELQSQLEFFGSVAPISNTISQRDFWTRSTSTSGYWTVQMPYGHVNSHYSTRNFWFWPCRPFQW